MLKTVSKRVITYVPISERKLPEAEQTKVCFIPMSKEVKDEYNNSLIEIKKGKVHRTKNAIKELFSKCLHPDEAGVFIYNASIADDKGGFIDYPKVTDKQMAIGFLLGLSDTDTADEIEQVMKGQSVLDEEEEKN